MRRNAAKTEKIPAGLLFCEVLRGISLFCRSLALDHAVADADLGEDIGGLGRIFLDLAADVRHVDAQDLVVAAGAGASERADEIVIRQHLARVQAEKGDELILVLREHRILPCNVDAVLCIVDGEIARPENAGVGDGFV